MGLDSIKYIRLAGKIEELFHIKCTPIIFFKYQTLEEIATYIETELCKNKVQTTDKKINLDRAERLGDNKDIAIIGISCNFPGGAINKEIFWENMIKSKDCISRVSESRQSIIVDYFNKYGKDKKDMPLWGGFIENVDCFDAKFFGIAPIEAESMDPQQRKILELVWNLIEDSGYAPESLSGKKIGVFIGAHSNDYTELLADNANLMEIYQAYTDTGTHMSLLANRVSRWFNFNGPSEVINTACSNSLVAIHNAVSSIRRGESKGAIAGGINIILSSRVYTACEKAGMLSKDGHCKTFDESADGFVRSEGYGAIYLKPYNEAIKDHDRIYGIIKGSAVNHDGKSSSLRAPNLNAQKELLKSAILDAKISPETISYIETHGTGTALGDPIEVQALKEAFEEMKVAKNKKVCGLGSVKTIIGHCEAASGIASVIKVLLALREHQLPKNLNFNKLNPYISLEDSPFYLVTDTREWTVSNDLIPRRAGISSFGASGTNAHIIIEEYRSPDQELTTDITEPNIMLFPFSAQNIALLKGYMQEMCKYFSKLKTGEFSLRDIAYTLQVGRTMMKERVVFSSTNIEDLIRKMRLFINGEENIEGCWQSRQEMRAQPVEDTLLNLIHRGREDVIARAYTTGVKLDWETLYTIHKPYRVHLPGSLFRKDRFWIVQNGDSDRNQIEHKESNGLTLTKQALANDEERYMTTIDGTEIFITNHVINGKQIVPGSMYIEMLRAAYCDEDNEREVQKGLCISNLIWVQPLVIDTTEPITLNLSMKSEVNGKKKYLIYKGKQYDDEQSEIYCTGTVSKLENSVGYIDYENLKTSCNLGYQLGEKLYDYFKTIGIDYGKAHKNIKEIWLGEKIAIAKLEADRAFQSAFEKMQLHPSMIDSVLQVAIIFSNQRQQYVAYKVEHMEIYNKCPEKLWVIAEKINANKCNLTVCDQAGNICMIIKGFVLARLNEEAVVAQPIMLHYDWKERPYIPPTSLPQYQKRVLFIMDMKEEHFEKLHGQLNDTECILLNEQLKLEDKYATYALRIFEKVKELMKLSVVPISIQIIGLAKGENKILLGLEGILKVAYLENPNINGQVIALESWDEFEIDMLKFNQNCMNDRLIRYKNGLRQVMKWKEEKLCIQEVSSNQQSMFKNDGKYLIIGGTGGLGTIMIKDIIAQTQNAVIIVGGRSIFNEEIAKKLKKLEKNNVQLYYIQMDSTNRNQVNTAIESIQEQHGNMDGIIYMAGIIKDNYILRKSKEEFKSVLDVKVKGLVNIDEVYGNRPLDFFMIFASISGCFGNVGQVDYGTANLFMDYYATYRNELRECDKRQGHTVSIGWPLWKNGGMTVDESIEKLLKKQMGMVAIDDVTGMKCLHNIYETRRNHAAIIYGDVNQMMEYINDYNNILGSTIEQVENSIDDHVIEEKAIIYLKEIISHVLRMPVEEIDVQLAFNDYGIDSIAIMRINSKLEEDFGKISKTLFYEYNNVQELAHYLLVNFREQLINQFSLNQVNHNKQCTYEAIACNKVDEYNNDTTTIEVPDHAHEASSDFEEIAIIGLAGKYPEANDLNQFWENLSTGKDCISEVPRKRWNHSKYYAKDKNTKGKTYAKWGGFIEDVDCFDPLFFNISPVEAEKMDPQERLFLQCAEEVIQDAGYSHETLSNYEYNGIKGNVGVFVGAMFQEYELYSGQMIGREDATMVRGLISYIPNRVSYAFNLHGPSIALDTMCSSALTAVHLACKSLQNNECGMAIVGGTNVCIHPYKFFMLGQERFASAKGHCSSFGDEADGYVPAEGIGALLLKKLSIAVKDGDHIYGIIKATAVNHGGKASGFTVPNPNAQAEVIETALKCGNIDPRTISYIEAHGTGTALGDPIEVTGLTKVFRKYTKDKQYCVIGSAKANIGHCESAAGIAAITKVLLQMKHKTIPPSIKCEVLNKNINFEDTPFYVQKESKVWDRITIDENGIEREYPRRAGISAFGAGGANAHMIIEEYIETPVAHRINNYRNKYMIPLSAKSQQQLEYMAKQLLASVEEGQINDENIENVAYTLQTGRMQLEERVALIITSVSELKEKLTTYINGDKGANGIFCSNINKFKEFINIATQDEDMQEVMIRWLKHEKYDKVLYFWVNGINMNWKLYYEDYKPQKVSLPVYPFLKEKYWVGGGFAKFFEEEKGSSNLHPLVHQNTSTLNGQRFTSKFNGEEFFFKDHTVKGIGVLPAAAYLEMIRFAINQSLPSETLVTLKISNIMWSRMYSTQSLENELYIGLGESEQQNVEQIGVEFEVYDNEGTLCKGNAIAGRLVNPQQVKIHDINTLRNQCTKEIDKDAFYNTFLVDGIHYNNVFRAVHEIYVGKDEILTKLIVDSNLMTNAELYFMNPAIIDASLQSVMGLFMDETDQALNLPFALEEIEIFKRTEEIMWVYARKHDQVDSRLKKFNIDLCDNDGNVCIHMKNLVLKEVY